MPPLCRGKRRGPHPRAARRAAWNDWRGELPVALFAAGGATAVTLAFAGGVIGEMRLDVDAAGGVTVADDVVYVVDGARAEVAVYDRADVPGVEGPDGG